MLSLVQNVTKVAVTVAYCSLKDYNCCRDLVLEPRSAKFFESEDIHFLVDEDDADVKISEYQEDMF